MRVILFILFLMNPLIAVDEELGILYPSIKTNIINGDMDSAQKYEFYFVPSRVRRVSQDATVFRTNASATLLYLKANSLIYFETEYLFAINK